LDGVDEEGNPIDEGNSDEVFLVFFLFASINWLQIQTFSRERQSYYIFIFSPTLTSIMFYFFVCFW
jgi:hypothetical protein